MKKPKPTPSAKSGKSKNPAKATVTKSQNPKYAYRRNERDRDIKWLASGAREGTQSTPPSRQCLFYTSELLLELSQLFHTDFHSLGSHIAIGLSNFENQGSSGHPQSLAVRCGELMLQEDLEVDELLQLHRAESRLIRAQILCL